MSVSRKNLAAALQEPFPDEVIKPVTKGEKTFSNVAPHHYIERLHEAAPLDYSVESGEPRFHPCGVISVVTKVTLHTDGGDRVFTGIGAEPIPPDATPDDLAFGVKSAQSDALKLALKPTGLGIHLYNSEVKVAKTTSAKRASAPAPQEDEEYEQPNPEPRRTGTPSGGWNGSLEINFGKFKGMKFSDPGVDDGYIQWGIDTMTDPKNKTRHDMLTKEKQRRVAAGTWSPDAPRGRKGPPIKKRSLDEEEDF